MKLGRDSMRSRSQGPGEALMLTVNSRGLKHPEFPQGEDVAVPVSCSLQEAAQGSSQHNSIRPSHSDTSLYPPFFPFSPFIYSKN